MSLGSSILVRFLGDDSGLKKAVDDAQGHLGKLDKKIGEFGKDLAKGAAAGLGAAAIADFARDGIKLASDLNEATSKNAKIFGASAREIEEAAKGAAETMGMSRAEYAESAGSLGILGQAAGLAGKDLADFATTAAQRAADIGSFNNATTPEVIEAWGSAMRGEMEPMRRFGVLLDDATLRQEALRLGLVRTTKDALSPQTKALAANSLIMKQTSIAAGDFADTSDGLANQSKILTARVDNLKIAVGQGLTPALLAAAEGFVGAANKADGFFESIGGNEGAVRSFTGALSDALTKGINPVQAAMRRASEESNAQKEAQKKAEKELAEEVRYSGSQADLYVKSLIQRNAAGKEQERVALTAAEAEKALKEQEQNLAQAAKDAAKGLEDQEKASRDLLKASEDLFLSQLDLEETVQHFPEKINDLKKAHEDVTKAEKDHGAGSDELRVAHEKQADVLRDLQRGIADVGQKAQEAAANKKAAAGGGELTALEMYQSQKDALDKLALEFPEVKVAIDQYMSQALDPLLSKSKLVRDTSVTMADDIAAAWRNADGTITMTADAAERRAGGGSAPSAAPPAAAPRSKLEAVNEAYGNGNSTITVIHELRAGNGIVMVEGAALGAKLADALVAHERVNGPGWRTRS